MAGETEVRGLSTTNSDLETWQERFLRVVNRAGGWPTVWDRLTIVVSTSPGYRNIGLYRSLFDLTERPEFYDSVYVRAWLVITAADGTAADVAYLGLTDDGLPALVGEDKVRRLLEKSPPR